MLSNLYDDHQVKIPGESLTDKEVSGLNSVQRSGSFTFLCTCKVSQRMINKVSDVSTTHRRKVWGVRVRSRGSFFRLCNICEFFMHNLLVTD